MPPGPATCGRPAARATWLGGTYDPRPNLLFFGTGNPGAVEQLAAAGRQPVRSLDAGHRPGQRRDQVALPGHAARRLGLRRRERVRPVRLEKDGKKSTLAPRPTATASSTCSTATNGKFVNAFAVRHARSPGPTGIDDEDRPAELRRAEAGPATRRPADGKKGTSVFAAPEFLGGKNWMPMAYSQNTGLFYVPANEWGMDIWNEPITYKKGAAYLGAGFTIKPLYDDHIGALRAIDPKTGKIKWEVQEQGAAVGRGADHRRQPGVLRHARGLPAGVRRQDRRGAVEVPDRLRRGRLADHLGAGRRAVRRRRLGLGRRGAAVGRRRRQGGQVPSTRAARSGPSSWSTDPGREPVRRGGGFGCPFCRDRLPLDAGGGLSWPEEPGGGSGSMLKVLVADDHPLFREAVVLSRSGIWNGRIFRSLEAGTAGRGLPSRRRPCRTSTSCCST